MPCTVPTSGGANPPYLGWIATGTAYEHRGLSPGTKYRYQVTHYVGGTVRSNVEEATGPKLPPQGPEILTTPSSPVDFSARGSESMIALSWKEPWWEGSRRFDAYTLYRADGNSCEELTEYETGIAASTTYWEDTGVSAGQDYCYQLSATNYVGESPRSETHAVTAVNMGNPQDLRVTTGSIAARIGLTWTAPPDDGGGPVDGYDVYRCEQTGADACVPTHIGWVVDGEQYEDKGVTEGTTYRYAVDAVRANVVSARTNEVSFSLGASAVVSPGRTTQLPVRVAYNGTTRTDTIWLLSDSGVPAGLLFELPVIDLATKLSLWSIRVYSESARDSAPPAPSGLVHAADRVLSIHMATIKNLPSPATLCVPLGNINEEIDLGSVALYQTEANGQSWTALEAVTRPGSVCGATRQFTRFAVFGRLAEETPAPDPETPSAADGAPTALTVTSISATAIVLSWTATAEDGGGPVEAYNVYRCEDGETSCELTADHWIAWVTSGTTFSDTHDDSDPAEAGGTSPVTPGTTYRYAVAAYRAGEGNWSNEVTATVEAGNGDAAPGPRFTEDASIGDLVFTAGEAIEPITLPAAAGGDIDETLNNGELSVYSFDPVDLPAGLTFDRFTRVMQGTPARTLEKTDYTYWVHDDDEDYSRADSDNMGFTITIVAAGGNAPQLLSQADRVLLEDVSASMARSMLSSVVPTIGSRFTASNDSRFALAGRQLTLGEMAERLSGDIGRTTVRSANTGFSSALGGDGTSLAIHRIGERPYADALSGVPGGEGVAGHQVLGGDRLLLGSGFATRLAGDLENARQWMLWGRSDIQSFQSGSADGGSFSGDVRTGYLGLDGRTGERALFGVALSHSLGQAEYAGSDSAGTMQMEVTTVLPYARFTPDHQSEAWIVLGAGRGERQTFVDGLIHESGALAPKLGALGGRRKFESGIAGIDWEIRGDVEHMSLASVYDVEISASRARLGLEGSSTLRFGSEAFARPFLELGVRYDEGAGRHTGAGVEVVAGAVFRHSRSGFWLEARGRTLLLHATADYKESGFSLTAGLQPSADGTGLSVLLSPQWGGSAEGSNAIWGDHGLNPARPGIAMTQDERSIRSEVAYGFLAPHTGAMIQPFGEIQASGESHRRARLGARYRHMTGDQQLELELSTDIAAADSFDRTDALDSTDWQYDFLLRGNLRF